MNDIVMFIISIISLILEIILISKLVIKKYKNDMDKLIDYIILVILSILLILLIIYYFDRYNIPSKFNLDVNVNTQNWLSIIGNYATGIISSSIGAIVSVWTTLYQIKKIMRKIINEMQKI